MIFGKTLITSFLINKIKNYHIWLFVHFISKLIKAIDNTDPIKIREIWLKSENEFQGDYQSLLKEIHNFIYENEDFDLRVVNSGDATEEKLLSILSSMKGFDSIITIGENPYIEFLNRMPFYIRKKSWC